MIKIRGLVKTYGKNTVLDGIDLDIEKGEVVALIGPSGTGKSTFLRSINLLEKPDAGELTIDGRTYDLAKVTKKDTVAIRRSTAMVFQQFNLFKNRTALQNVMEGLTVVKKVPKQEARERALAELRNVGLEAWQDHYPQHLSGGQQQRVACARAIMARPSVIFADEPTGNLDSRSSREVLGFLKDSVHEYGQTIVMVTHDPRAASYADRVLVLADGRIIRDLKHPTYERILAEFATEGDADGTKAQADA